MTSAILKKPLPHCLKAIDLWVFTGCILLAWIHRVAFLFSNVDRSWPFSIFYQGDALAFFLHARALLSGHLHDGGIPFHPPGFPYFLTFIHYLVGAGPDILEAHHLKVKLLLAVAGSLPIGLIYLLASPYLGRPIALLTAFLCLYHFGMYIFAIAPVSESVYLTMFLFSLFIWTRYLDHPLNASLRRRPRTGVTWMVSLFLGILLGFLALTRAEGLLIAITLFVIGLIGCLARYGKRTTCSDFPVEGGSSEIKRGKTAFIQLVPWLLVAIGWTLPIIPWTIRNAFRISDVNQRLQLQEPLPRFVPLTLYGPLNLALANHSKADGTFSRDILISRESSGAIRLTDPQHLNVLLHGDKLAWRYIRRHPVEFAQLVLKKWHIFFDAFKLGWTQWNWPGGLSGFRRPVDVFVPYSSAASWRLIPLFLLGLLFCLLVGKGPRRWAIIVMIMTGDGLLVSGLFFGYVRQGLLFIPLWFTMVATGIFFIANLLISLAGKHISMRGSWDRYAIFQLKIPGPLLIVLCVVAFLLLSVEIWGARANRNYQAQGIPIAGLQNLNPDAAVHIRVLPRRSKRE